MARWILQQQGEATSVESLQEFVDMAKEGRILAGDLVQPVNAPSWFYVSEIPELAAHASDPAPTPVKPSVVPKVIVAFGLVMTMVALWELVEKISTMREEPKLIHAESNLENAFVTSDAPVFASLDASSPTSNLVKNQQVELLDKRGDFFKIKLSEELSGWVSKDHVVPLYTFGDDATRAKFDAKYYPERYVEVGRAKWKQDAENPGKTFWGMEVTNRSPYAVENLQLEASIRDSAGNEIEKITFAVKGAVPGASDGMDGRATVGTLGDEILTSTLAESKIAENESLREGWTPGVSVSMKSSGFSSAQITVREASKVKSD